MVITNISDAKASLSKLIELVLQGQEVIIGKAGKPVAKIVPYDENTSPCHWSCCGRARIGRRMILMTCPQRR